MGTREKTSTLVKFNAFLVLRPQAEIPVGPFQGLKFAKSKLRPFKIFKDPREPRIMNKMNTLTGFKRKVKDFLPI